MELGSQEVKISRQSPASSMESIQLNNIGIDLDLNYQFSFKKMLAFFLRIFFLLLN